jgi:hypothetical protein
MGVLVAVCDLKRAQCGGFLAAGEAVDTLRRIVRSSRRLEYYSRTSPSISAQIDER